MIPKSFFIPLTIPDIKEIKQSLSVITKENASKLWRLTQEAGDYLLC